MEQLNAVATRCLILPENSGRGSAGAGRDLGDCEDDSTVLKSKNWLLYSAALWQRCKAEYHRGKTVERACLQLRALIDQFNGERRQSIWSPLGGGLDNSLFFLGTNIYRSSASAA